MDLVFATHNLNKIKEIEPLLPPYIRLHTLQSIGCSFDIPETGATLEENALQKAKYISERYGYGCFADDTGLLVKALNDAPGVHSARYAGSRKNADENMDKLLRELEGNPERRARFETVIALILEGETRFFRGTVHGEITLERSGKAGFGYDPIFRPAGSNLTFAALPLEEKNRISHRARAFDQLIRYLGGLRTNS